MLKLQNLSQYRSTHFPHRNYLACMVCTLRSRLLLFFFSLSLFLSSCLISINGHLLKIAGKDDNGSFIKVSISVSGHYFMCINKQENTFMNTVYLYRHYMTITFKVCDRNNAEKLIVASQFYAFTFEVDC